MFKGKVRLNLTSLLSRLFTPPLVKLLYVLPAMRFAAAVNAKRFTVRASYMFVS